MLTTNTIREGHRGARGIFFEAIILTLLLHLLLLVVFVYLPPKKIYTNTQTAGITFMNLSNQSPEKRQQLLNWMEYHEPSLISAPNAKHGYNQLIPRLNSRKVLNDMEYEIVLPQSPQNSPANFSNLNMHKQRENNIAKNYIFHRLGQVASSAKIVKKEALAGKTEFPLTRYANKNIELSFSPSLLKNAEKLYAKPMDIDFDWGKGKLFPRVIVHKSSGNYDFDMAVLREVMAQIEKISQKREEFRLHIQWREESRK